jgi:hypothetical protein
MTSDHVLDPPLVLVEIASIGLLDDELDTNKGFGVVACIDAGEMDQIVRALGSERDDVERPWVVFSRGHRHSHNESLLGVCPKAPNEHIPADAVRSAHVSNGDEVI